MTREPEDLPEAFISVACDGAGWGFAKSVSTVGWHSDALQLPPACIFTCEGAGAFWRDLRF